MKSSERVLFLFALLVSVSTVSLICNPTPASSSPTAGQEHSRDVYPSVFRHESDVCVLQETDGSLVCRNATAEEAITLTEWERNEPLHVVYQADQAEISPQTDGLKIILRGTQQLEMFPEAKTAYIRAAQVWENLIATPITVVIDVDYGPTRFGQPFPEGALGFATGQNLINFSAYPSFRSRLISGASNAREASLYNALPIGAVPTDIGNTAAVLAPSPLWRAAGLNNPVADPAREPNLGPPPSIQVNSNGVKQDFDPTDGIDPDKFDFEGGMYHEIGHALGFSSNVGRAELDPSITIAVSLLDFFRLRPGTTLSSFPAAQRILSSGSNQVFFTGDADLALSTGRPNGTGGDGRQGSHWKDDSLSGIYVGDMDPTLRPGERRTLTINDLTAIDLMGYRLRAVAEVGNGTPAMNTLAADLNGDLLTVTGSVTDPDGDMTTYAWQFNNDDGRFVTGWSEGAGLGFSTAANITRQFLLDGAHAPRALAATSVTLVIIDSRGNRSVRMADFSQADPGGSTVKRASFDATSSNLSLKGKGFTGQLQIEINGRVIAPPLLIKAKSSGKKLTVNGAMSDLNLSSGPNRVRVLNGGLRSNIFVLDL